MTTAICLLIMIVLIAKFRPSLAKLTKRMIFIDISVMELLVFGLSDLWSAVWKFVRSTANQTKPVLVTAGPIFDYNSDGLADDIHNLSK